MAHVFYVVLVGSKYGGNVGSAARVIMNFGLDNLVLVEPQCTIDEEARKMAVHAQQVLANAPVFDTLEDALANLEIHMALATTAKITEKEKKIRRAGRDLAEIDEVLSGPEGNVALVFGREDFGLLDPEIELCDEVIRIPTSPRYPSMNLSHSVVCVLYELYRTGLLSYETERTTRSKAAPTITKERLIRTFNTLLEDAEYPGHKVEGTTILFKRLLARSELTKWECSRLIGAFSSIDKAISKK